MEFILIIIGILVFCFLKLFSVKMNHPYEGRHRIGEIKEVPAFYHPNDSAWVPTPVRHRKWWNMRMQRAADKRPSFLTAPIYLLEEYTATKLAALETSTQQALALALSNWKWVDVPLKEWPLAWQQPAEVATDTQPATLKKVISDIILPERQRDWAMVR